MSHVGENGMAACIQNVALLPSRDSGNDFCFPDFASHTGRFRLIFVCISSIVSFRVDMRSDPQKMKPRNDQSCFHYLCCLDRDCLGNDAKNRVEI